MFDLRVYCISKNCITMTHNSTPPIAPHLSFSQYGPSRNPMSFRKAEPDPYQHAFLQHTSSLKEHKEKITNVCACVHVYVCG